MDTISSHVFIAITVCIITYIIIKNVFSCPNTFSVCCVMLTLNVTGVEAAIENSNSEVLHSYGYDTGGSTLHAATAVVMPFFHFFWQNVHTVDHKS